MFKKFKSFFTDFKFSPIVWVNDKIQQERQENLNLANEQIQTEANAIELQSKRLKSLLPILFVALTLIFGFMTLKKYAS